MNWRKRLSSTLLLIFNNFFYLCNFSVASTTIKDKKKSLVPLISYRHASLHRNKRCLLAYLYNRLQYIKEMRWQFGPTIPNDIKQLLCESEVQWFNAYSKNLASYMIAVGENCGNFSIDLTSYTKPPKSLYIEVRCLSDYGRFELESGEVILLKKNSQHYLPRSECELLVRQGILQHVE